MRCSHLEYRENAAMNVENILERKGREVVASNDDVLGIISERDIVRAFFSVRRARSVHASKGHHDARLDHRVLRGRPHPLDASDDSPSRSPCLCFATASWLASYA